MLEREQKLKTKLELQQANVHAGKGSKVQFKNIPVRDISLCQISDTVEKLEVSEQKSKA